MTQPAEATRNACRGRIVIGDGPGYDSLAEHDHEMAGTEVFAKFAPRTE
jgi:hypothetical protein